MNSRALFSSVPVRPRILYVDDVPELRLLVRHILARADYDVVTAAHGAEAHQLVAAAPEAFDLVLTEHYLPHLTGLELVACLRALQFPGQVAVLACACPPEVCAAFHRYRVDAYLEKPITPDELRAVLRRLLARADSAPPRACPSPTYHAS